MDLTYREILLGPFGAHPPAGPSIFLFVGATTVRRAFKCEACLAHFQAVMKDWLGVRRGLIAATVGRFGLQLIQKNRNF
jgi:hypothetical protein